MRQQCNQLQDEYLPVGSGFQFDTFEQTLDHETAVIEWYILDETFLAFIILPPSSDRKEGEVIVWQSTTDDRQQLGNWGNTYLQNYYSERDTWRNTLADELQKLAGILYLNELLAHLPASCQRLILIPHRFLHLFPLHALPVQNSHPETEPRYLLDIFPNGVSYAPSCQLLQQVQTRQRLDFKNLFAVQNPTKDLDYADLEVQVIASNFQPAHILKKDEATLQQMLTATAFPETHCFHFSGHGYFNSNNPLKSALLPADVYLNPPPSELNAEHHLELADGTVLDLQKCLTLDKIFGLKLKHCRLVTLSACETGLVDFRNISDEYIGLPSGFLIAGSSAVISSLWIVSDISTALLVVRFYQNIKSGLSLAVALQEAQFWLRNATTIDLGEWAKTLPKADHRKQLRMFLRQEKSDSKPFTAPYYWAAFCAIGE